MRLPDFIVIGGMRCGTTTLYHLLRQCGGIYMPPVKEIHFFDRRNPALDESAARYAEVFSAAGSAQRCGEVTPDYLTTHRCAERIHALVPDVRLVTILRDPVERAWSHYLVSCLNGVETLPLAEALEAEPERLGDGTDRSDIFFSYLQRSRYVEHLERYEALFGRKAMLVLFLEELATDAAGQGKRLLEHLGVPAVQIPSRPNLAEANEMGDLYWHHNAGSVARPRALLYRLGRVIEGRNTWRNEAQEVSALRRRTGRRLQRLALPLPRLTPGDRADLGRRLADHDSALSRWLGRAPPWTPG